MCLNYIVLVDMIDYTFRWLKVSVKKYMQLLLFGLYRICVKTFSFSPQRCLGCRDESDGIGFAPSWRDLHEKVVWQQRQSHRHRLSPIQGRRRQRIIQIVSKSFLWSSPIRVWFFSQPNYHHIFSLLIFRSGIDFESYSSLDDAMDARIRL